MTVHPPSTTSLSPLVARTFTFETYTFLFREFTKAQDVCESIKALVTSGALTSFNRLSPFAYASTASLSSCYAFSYKSESPASAQDGWNVYDPKRELARMGVGGEKQRTEAWRWSDVNADYEVRASAHTL